MNNNLILVSGMSATGKSMSLRNVKDPEGVLYLNCESNKSLPFKSGKDFRNATITDPVQVYELIAKAATVPDKIHTIALDSLSFLMNMYESLYVLPSTNTQKAWGDYSQFFQNLMQQYFAKSPQRIVIFAHTTEFVNDDKISQVAVKVKGSLMNTGIEAYFSNVISTKKISLKRMEGIKSDLLTVTPREEAIGYKHVFQTNLTKDTVNERIRGPLDMWADNELYIDNNIELVFKRIADYYGD